ncbi:MAG: hypothetical protein DRQ49_01905 [Gammaproteobacteria bacterium]|nr:MAG: hypothetical protein DRQ49_01905 [Gammaproteobacteria bacterium]RKZ44590.1 MAG: hypothetical protein DRQ41_02435 [Gammaproteobacteria bacterium]RKZ76783.1 MAG: hypothetical protein DRQ57_02460 [Gammaproteobacteria bacterium]
MSYILDALQKAEYEREMAQFINNDIDNKGRRSFLQTSFWLWITIILLMNILLFTVLLWPKKNLTAPQVHIIATVVQQVHP